MKPLVSFIATLGLLGVAFTFLHWLIVALGRPDIVALLLALPLVGYIGYCTQDTRAAMCALANLSRVCRGNAVTAGLVYLID